MGSNTDTNPFINLNLESHRLLNWLNNGGSPNVLISVFEKRYADGVFSDYDLLTAAIDRYTAIIDYGYEERRQMNELGQANRYAATHYPDSSGHYYGHPSYSGPSPNAYIAPIEADLDRDIPDSIETLLAASAQVTDDHINRSKFRDQDTKLTSYLEGIKSGKTRRPSPEKFGLEPAQSEAAAAKTGEPDVTPVPSITTEGLSTGTRIKMSCPKKGK
jgi:hypothetical protein